MAYLAPVRSNGAQPIQNIVPAQLSPDPATFTPLEFSVIRLSRGDPLWSIIPSSFQRLLNVFLARKANRLANDRLEALRQMAVLSRHFGFAVPATKVGQFLEAGFSVEQYEFLVKSLQSSTASPAIGSAALT